MTQEQLLGVIKTKNPIKENRTIFCRDFLFPRIANELDMVLYKEFLRVDLSIGTKSDFATTFEEHQPKIDVRQIYIEYENDIDGWIYRELEKLCSINAPLKVLLTWHWDWNNDKEEYIKPQEGWADWNRTLKAYTKELGQLVGDFYIIIGESIYYVDGPKSLKFYTYTWNKETQQFGDEEVIFSRILAASS